MEEARIGAGGGNTGGTNQIQGIPTPYSHLVVTVSECDSNKAIPFPLPLILTLVP
jgi:hypothetical protein